MRTVTESLRNQLGSCLHMAKALIENIPDELWASAEPGAPVWRQVYHFVFYLDYWIRDDYDKGGFRCMEIDGGVAYELHGPVAGEPSLSRNELRDYLAAIERKTEGFFDRLDDRMLAEPVSRERPDPLYTRADAIVGQIRHVMYNIGCLNAVLRRHGLPEADWYAYNEEEGA